MTTWFPFSFASPHDLRKYSSFCNLADCPTPIAVSPAPAGSLGDSYALALAKRPLQWAAADDTTRLSIGFVYPDFDDTAVSGWGKKYIASPAACMRVLSESLDMHESSWESVIDDSSSAADEGCNWAFIATWNDWNETTRIEPAWRQAFIDDIADPGYDRDDPDQSTYFAQGTIDACLGRLLAVEEGIAAFKGNSAPGASDLDRLLSIAGRYLTGTSWPGWE